MKMIITSIGLCFISFIAFTQNKYTPLLFGDHIISTATGYETHPSFSPSGDTVYFLQCAPDLSASSIYMSVKKKEEWSAPRLVIFSGKYFDADPFVTKDGNTLYFTSNRPIKNGDSIKADTDIWRVEKTNGGTWGKPIHLGPVINSNRSEHYPTLADNGNMYFGSERDGGKGGADIYYSKWIDGQYTTPLSIGDSINSPSNEYEPFILPDETRIIFMTTRPDGLANADFYISDKVKGQWRKPVKIGTPINSDGIEWAPKITRDGRYLYFGSTRNRPGGDEKNKGLSDIYYVPTGILPFKKKTD
jgi:Tol biopolymer transport system component